MSMKFETRDRPDSGIQRKLLEEATPLSKIPFPKQVEEPCVNFQEVLGSDRYKEIVDNFKQYVTPNYVLNGFDIMPLMMVMMEDHENIVLIERPHREQLERLAIELVLKEMGIPEGSFQFDAKIVDPNRIDTSDFNHGMNEQKQPEVDIDDEVILSEKIDLEAAKRRMINAIIQGSSERGHYMYHIVEDKLVEMTGNENLVKLYGRLMSINDTMYWQLSDDMIKAMGGGDGDAASAAGKEKIDRNTKPTTIYARAVNFPVLIHEIIKGIMEVFAVHGLPESYEDFASEEETIDNEMWDLRLGPSIWKRVRSQFPIEIITDEDKVEQQNYLLVEMFKLPADEFLYLMRELMKGSDEGKREIAQLIRKIENDQKEEEQDEYEDD